MRKFIDLTGQRFGRLIVIEQAPKDKWRNVCWLCKCECKQKLIVRSSSLKSGNTKSCGCLNVEKIKQRFTKHGYRKRGKITRIYYLWYNMIQRCINPNNKRYKDYGGRGIKVCKRWLKFENFLKDMGECPEGKSIDRKNNNKNYCKSNCRWATPKEQARNRRNNRLITFNEKTQCIAAWAKEYNINYETLWHRLYRSNWSIEKALTTPVRKCKKGKVNG